MEMTKISGAWESLSLSGAWEMGYTPEEYTSQTVPSFEGTLIECAVPGYFEDMTDAFRAAPFFDSLVVNPEYEHHEYPMTGYPPDMVLPNYVGSFFYKRSFNAHTCADAALCFEGVQNAASVWINGRFLLRHEGYSAPFEVDIPAGLLRDGENEITLAVSNHPLRGFDSQPVSGITSRAASRYSGGITGEVELRIYKGPLRSLSVRIGEDCESVSASVRASEDCDICWSVLDEEKTVKSGNSKLNFTFDTKNLERWSPSSPKLYTLKVECRSVSIEKRFGVRRLTADGQQFRLNGEPYYLRGVCEHCYYPLTVHPTHDKEFYVGVVKKLRELGFNFIRFHTYIPPREYLMAADELGMLVHAESPNNTSLAEWREIVDFCREFTSVVIYCCGNELQIDDLRLDHLRDCAEVVHGMTDALFSPMSAMRGVEYGRIEAEDVVPEPFPHNPRRFALLGGFSDMYSSYALEHFSYRSTEGDPELVSSWGEVYGRPRVTHEICIDGSYVDLSLEERYRGTRIGQTALFSSVRRHLQERGVLEKAPLYFKNSCEWQRRLRKYCFENTRRCANMAGYDFLGPIDTHWHTFGYDVGMMNEFYELKPGESVENVLRYNSPAVLLTDLGRRVNYRSGDRLTFNMLLSAYEISSGEGLLSVGLDAEGMTPLKKELRVSVENGGLQRLAALDIPLPEVDSARKMILSADLTLDGVCVSRNEWELYLFPRAESPIPEGITLSEGMSREELLAEIRAGNDVVLLGADPFVSLETSFRMTLAGRTSGFMATVIGDHGIFRRFDHEGYCGWQFSHMLDGGRAVVFADREIPFDPIVEVVSPHKNVLRSAAVFDMRVGASRIFVCALRLSEEDPAAEYLRSEILRYVSSEGWTPSISVTEAELSSLLDGEISAGEKNENLAVNKNDITAN